MKNDKEVQKKYAEFQLLQQQLESIQKYIEELDIKQNEFQQTKEGMNKLEKVKSGSELFVPIAQGIFVKARLNDMDEILVNVGANIAVAKSIPKVTELMENQIGEIQNIRIQLDESVEKITERLNILLGELQVLS